jgi:hypothetical protein
MFFGKAAGRNTFPDHAAPGRHRQADVEHPAAKEGKALWNKLPKKIMLQKAA